MIQNTKQLSTFLSLGLFFNEGVIIEESFNYYFPLFILNIQKEVTLSSVEESNNRIMNYFWGICTANREEITKKVRVKYASK